MVATKESAVQQVIASIRDFYHSVVDPTCERVNLVDTEDGEYLLSNGEAGGFIPQGVDSIWKSIFEVLEDLFGRVIRSVSFDFQNLKMTVA